MSKFTPISETGIHGYEATRKGLTVQVVQTSSVGEWCLFFKRDGKILHTGKRVGPLLPDEQGFVCLDGESMAYKQAMSEARNILAGNPAPYERVISGECQLFP